MGSVGNPNPWAPYANHKDCSRGICSVYCPQWCYIIFPPPPLGFSDDSSGADFSPLIIAVIGILASAFLLVCYYTIISKYCRRRGDHNTSAEFDQNRDEMNHDQAWQVAPTGLDDAVIKSITICKYKKGDGLVEGTDCSVCLNEFQDDESLRLLPKCNHAFHLPCIDTWLKSHSSCPLCRSTIASSNSLPHPIPEARPNINISAFEYQHRNDHSVLVVHDLESVQPAVAIVRLVSEVIPKTSIHAHGDDEDSEERDSIIEIEHFRRSVSLDSSSSRQGHLSIADILRISEDDDDSQMGNLQFPSGENGESNNGLHLVRSPVARERSISTGRFMFSRDGKETNYIIPN